MTLNTQQNHAATYEGKHLLVLAGAGTGKTRTIIARASHLIKSGVDPKRILILSFTRKSAAEIVDRISQEIPNAKSEGLTGSTFHSWCMSIITRFPDVFPHSQYTLLDDDDQESCFKLVCGRGWSYKNIDKKKVTPETVSNVYSYMVNTGCSLTAAIRMKIYNNAPESKNVDKDRDVLKDIISGYIEYKKSRRYFDYDDILLVVSKYLKRNEDLRKHIAGMYDHILIDEMQDTNPLQYELLSSFYEDCHLFCVGDDAQSIYGFRGADFHSIHNFADIVKGAEVCKLTINYRSTQEILDLANWVIGNSPLGYDKELTASRGKGLLPEILHWRDEWDEAENIALKIIDEFKVFGKKWIDNLVLSRSVWGMRKVEGCFIKYKIPYTIFGGNGIMKSRHVRDLVAAMRIVNNYLDEIAWTRYLTLWKDIGDVKAAQIIERLFKENNLDDCLMALMDMGYQEEIAETLVRISNLQNDPVKAITEALSIMNSRFEERYNNEWNWRKEDFPILKEVAKNVGSISEFISEYILDPKADMKKKDGAMVEDRVILSTIHSAKGLEADCVYLVNASPNAYPTPRAVLNGKDAVEEERRCLYVALTRAKDKLRIYRSVQTTHISNNDERFYFLHLLPTAMYQNMQISTQGRIVRQLPFDEKIVEDIYSEIDLS